MMHLYILLLRALLFFKKLKVKILENDIEQKKLTILFEEKSIKVDYNDVRGKWSNYMYISDKKLNYIKNNNMAYLLFSQKM